METSYDFVALVGLYTAVAAAVDFRMQRIPNYVTVPAAVLGLLYHSFAPHGMGPLMALAGLAVGFGLLLLPWILGGGGMGDVKLLAALGAWLGPLMILIAFGLAAVTAGVIALCVVTGAALTHGVSNAKHKYLVAGSHGGTHTSGDGQRRPRRRTLPFAVPVALATWVLLGWLLLKQSLGI
jgi:prepilin peptidase CpaA